MVTRSRDLDAFIHGDPRDVRLIDCGDGLEFAAIGVVPERRLMLESVYGFLTLRNGVPIGYVLTSALFGSSEIAYNVFDTWRGGEAGHVYGRVLAMTRAVFGSRDFTIFPYQLGGDGNSEGIKSGAWWFYQKLGFRPRDPAVLALMERELARMAKRPAHRSTPGDAEDARRGEHVLVLRPAPGRRDRHPAAPPRRSRDHGLPGGPVRLGPGAGREDLRRRRLPGVAVSAAGSAGRRRNACGGRAGVRWCCCCRAWRPGRRRSGRGS